MPQRVIRCAKGKAHLVPHSSPRHNGHCTGPCCSLTWQSTQTLKREATILKRLMCKAVMLKKKKQKPLFLPGFNRKMAFLHCRVSNSAHTEGEQN